MLCANDIPFLEFLSQKKRRLSVTPQIALQSCSTLFLRIELTSNPIALRLELFLISRFYNTAGRAYLRISMFLRKLTHFIARVSTGSAHSRDPRHEQVLAVKLRIDCELRCCAMR